MSKLKVITTPDGRQQLLNNLYIRNHLMGKWISEIEPSEFDQEDTTPMVQVRAVTNFPGENYMTTLVDDKEIVEKLKRIIEERFLAYTTEEV